MTSFSINSLTADIYMGRKKRATGAAEVLEGLFQP